MAFTAFSDNTLSRLRQAGRRLGSKRQVPGSAMRWLPRLAEVLAVIVLAWLAVRLVYAFAPPQGGVAGQMGPEGTAATQISGDIGVFSRFDPFAARAVVRGEEDLSNTRETSLDIKLNGIWADADGGGIAILQAGNREQRMYQVGEEIMDGVFLDRLYPDRAIIMRAGSREAVFLENRKTQARPAEQAAQRPAQQQPSTPAVSSNQPARATVTAESLSSVVAIRPIRDNGQTLGYELFPRGDGALFARFGLVEGDRIKSINGIAVPVDSERIIEMMGDLPGGDVAIEVERGGETVDLTIDVSELK